MTAFTVLTVAYDTERGKVARWQRLRAVNIKDAMLQACSRQERLDRGVLVLQAPPEHYLEWLLSRDFQWRRWDGVFGVVNRCHTHLYVISRTRADCRAIYATLSLADEGY